MHFDENNNLVMKERADAPRGEICVWQLNVKFVDMIYWNLIAGKTWDMASPVVPITREQAAFILTEYKPNGFYDIRRVSKEVSRANA